jgi:hypothetical protein
MIVCVRHKILGMLPWHTRWHVHLEKETMAVGTDDYKIIFELQEWAKDKLFWEVEIFE